MDQKPAGLKRLAIITTHPVQYNAPVFRRLTERGMIHPGVFYTWGRSVLEKKYDPGFRKTVEWDIPLLDGYEYYFTENTAADPGSHHFGGIRNPQLIREISNWKPDALLVYGWSFKSHLYCLRHFHGKLPVLFRGDSTLLDATGGFKAILRKWFLKWVYRHADYALYTGKSNADYFRAFGMSENQLVFAPHVVDNSRFADTPERKYGERAGVMRREYGFSEKDTVFLFAGKLEPKKDPELLIRSFRSLDHPGIRLLIAGNGVLEQRLRELAGSDERIRFAGFHNQSEMPVLYRVANWLVLPSRGPGETWGLAVNEAMACGVPVITSDRCGCTADLVQSGVNGFYFSSGSLEALKLTLEKACNSDAAAMGRAAESFIHDWSPDRLCASIENLPVLQ